MRLSRFGARAMLVILAGSFASRAHATHCVGKVNFVEAYRDGNLIAGITGEGVQINRGILCNLKNQLGPVLAETCRAWASLLQASKLSGRPIELYVTGADGDPAACSDGGVNTTLWFERVESVRLW